jgi:hypothetical protein
LFRAQRTQAITSVAPLLGWSHAEVKRRATEEDALLLGDLVRWETVAAWLFESWSYEGIILALGDDAELLPVGLRAVPVLWMAPAWVIHGLNVQRQIEVLPHRTVRPQSLSEYLTDFLARGIDPNTVELLRGDADFMVAFNFPYGDTDV